MIPDELQMYYKFKFLIFPIHNIDADGKCTCGRDDCRSAGKHPRFGNWIEKASGEPLQWIRWKKQYGQGVNFGLCTGKKSGVVVLDVDPRHGGDESLHQLEKDLGVSLTDGPTVLTGGGGSHIYFRYPDGATVGNAVNLKGKYDGLDIRSDGGLVVIPPSVHQSGRAYEWDVEHHPDHIEFPEMPEKLLELLKSEAPRKPKGLLGVEDDWEPLENAAILETTNEVCARFRYLMTTEGAQSASYDDWIGMGSNIRKMTPDSTVFHMLSAKDPTRYDERATESKWRDLGKMGPRSCHRMQQDMPLPECEACPFYSRDWNVSLAVRMQLGKELGIKGPVGAPPKPNDNDERLNSLVSSVDEVAATAATVEAPDGVAVGQAVPAPAKKEGEGKPAQKEPPFKVVDGGAKSQAGVAAVVKKAVKDIEDGRDAGEVRDEIIKDLAALVNDPKVFDRKTQVKEHVRRIVNADAQTNKRARILTQKDLEEQVFSLAKGLQEAAKAEKQPRDDHILVSKICPDAPGDEQYLPIPFTGLKLDKERISIAHESDGEVWYEPVAYQFYYVNAVRRNVVTGEMMASIRVRQLTGDLKDAWAVITTPARALTDLRAIGDLKAKGLSVVNPKAVLEYLNNCYEYYVNVYGAPVGKSIDRLGYVVDEANDTYSIVLADGSIGETQIEPEMSPGTQTVTGKYRAKGNPDEEFRMIRQIIDKIDSRMAFGIGLASAAPLFRPLAERESIDFNGIAQETVYHGTGVGKTSGLKFSVAPWADPRVVRPADGTHVGLSEMMYAVGDFPFALQEVQVARKNSKNSADIGRVIHSLADGGSRIQGAKDGGVKALRTLFGVMMMANNQSMLEEDARNGERERVFSVPPLVHEGDKDFGELILETKEMLTQHHGNGGRQMLARLMQESDGIWSNLQNILSDELKKEMAVVESYIPADASKDLQRKLLRRARYIALIRMGWRYLIRYGYGDLSEVEREAREQYDDMERLAPTPNLESSGLQGIDDVWEELIRDQIRNERHNDDKLRVLDDVTGWIESESTKIRGCEAQRTFVAGGEERQEPIIPSYYIGTLIELPQKASDGTRGKKTCIGVYANRLAEFLKKNDSSLKMMLKAWSEFGYIIRDDDGKHLDRRNNQIDPATQAKFGRLVVFDPEQIGINIADLQNPSGIMMVGEDSTKKQRSVNRDVEHEDEI